MFLKTVQTSSQKVFGFSPFSSKGIPWFRWAFRPRLQPRGREMAHGDQIQQSFWWLLINQLPAGYVLSAMHHSDGAALWGSLSCTWISFSDSPRYQEIPRGNELWKKYQSLPSHNSFQYSLIPIFHAQTHIAVSEIQTFLGYGYGSKPLCPGQQ